MDVLHSLTTINVRRWSFSCFGNHYSLIFDQENSSRLSIYSPLKMGYWCIRGVYFDIPWFLEDAACLVDVDESNESFTLVSANRFGAVKIVNASHRFPSTTQTIKTIALDVRPIEMYAISQDEVLIRVNLCDAVIVNWRNRDKDAVVTSWTPCWKKLGQYKLLYSTFTSATRKYSVENHGACFVQCLEIPWITMPRGAFVSVCCT